MQINQPRAPPYSAAKVQLGHAPHACVHVPAAGLGNEAGRDVHTGMGMT